MIARLGGPQSAVSKLSLYLRLPARFAPHKGEACTLLAFCGDNASSVLVRELDNADVDVRYEAIIAVGLLGQLPTEAVPKLMRALQAEDCDERMYAATVLGISVHHQGQAIAAVIKDLGHPERDVRHASIGVAGPLAPYSKKLQAALRKVLKDKDTESRLFAAVELNGMGIGTSEDITAAIDDLKLALQGEKDELVLFEIKETLAWLSSVDVRIQMLEVALGCRNVQVRRRAVQGLAEVGVLRPDPAVRLLQTALRDEDAEICRIAGAALENIKAAGEKQKK